MTPSFEVEHDQGSSSSDTDCGGGVSLVKLDSNDNDSDTRGGVASLSDSDFSYVSCSPASSFDTENSTFPEPPSLISVQNEDESQGQFTFTGGGGTTNTSGRHIADSDDKMSEAWRCTGGGAPSESDGGTIICDEATSATDHLGLVDGLKLTKAVLDLGVTVSSIASGELSLKSASSLCGLGLTLFGPDMKLRPLTKSLRSLTSGASFSHCGSFRPITTASGGFSVISATNAIQTIPEDSALVDYALSKTFSSESTQDSPTEHPSPNTWQGTEKSGPYESTYVGESTAVSSRSQPTNAVYTVPGAFPGDDSEGSRTDNPSEQTTRHIDNFEPLRCDSTFDPGTYHDGSIIVPMRSRPSHFDPFGHRMACTDEFTAP